MRILIAALCIVAALAAVLITKTLIVRAKAKKPAQEKENIPPQMQAEYAARLGEMIRCKTVSVRGSYDDTEFAKLRNTVEKLFPLIHKKAEKLTFGDDCWVYKIKGKDASRNIMLMSHHDVVAAKGEWKHPEFCGEVFENEIWGRGTVDTKTSLFAMMQALEELLAEDFEPETNLWLGSSHNEEILGDGFPLAVEYFKKEGIEFEAVLDEGGGIIDPPLGGTKPKCAMIAVHEKGRRTLICTATHGKVKYRSANTCVSVMANFIKEVNSSRIFRRKLYPEVRAMFDHIGPHMPFALSVVFANLWLFAPVVKAIMPKINPMAGGMLGTTCYFTEISGNNTDKICTAKAYFRPMDVDDFEVELKKFRKIAAKYGIEVKDGPENEVYRPADISHRHFAYTRECIAEVFPHTVSGAYLLTAGTDARHMTAVSPCALRFAPIEITPQQFNSVHNENENIAVKSVANAVAFYKYYIKNYK